MSLTFFKEYFGKAGDPELTTEEAVSLCMSRKYRRSPIDMALKLDIRKCKILRKALKLYIEDIRAKEKNGEMLGMRFSNNFRSAYEMLNKVEDALDESSKKYQEEFKKEVIDVFGEEVYQKVMERK